MRPNLLARDEKCLVDVGGIDSLRNAHEVKDFSVTMLSTHREGNARGEFNSAVALSNVCKI